MVDFLAREARTWSGQRKRIGDKNPKWKVMRDKNPKGKVMTGGAGGLACLTSQLLLFVPKQTKSTGRTELYEGM